MSEPRPGVPGGVQTDFGRFDPKFLGVTLRIGSQRASDVLFGEDPSAAELEAQPEDLAFEAIAMKTAFVHEKRHFHDFLLSPFGAFAARRRFVAFMNAAQVLAELHSTKVREGSNVLPVPLSRWCRLSEAERAKRLMRWGLGAEDRAFALPSADGLVSTVEQTEWRPIGPDLFAEHVVLALDQYRLLEETFTAFGPFDLSEASALVIQAQEVWIAFGEYASELFVRRLRESSHTLYGRALDLPFRLLAAIGSVPDARRVSAMATWSVLGDVFAAGVGARSIERFGALARHLADAGYPEGDLGIAELFDRWDEAVGGPPTFGGVRASLDRDEEFAEKLQEITTAHPELAVFGLAAEVFEMQRMARRATVERFLASPEEYVTPLAYQEADRSYPLPPLVLELEAGRLEVPEDSPFLVLKGQKGVDGKLYAAAVAAPHVPKGPAPIDRKLALRQRDEFAVSDVLFSSQAPDPVDWDLCVAQFERSGVRVRQVI